MFNKFFIFLFILVNSPLNIQANEKQLIIDQLITINSIIFDFEQTSNNKRETGTCVLSFNNKLSCDYKDSMQKRILVNNKTLIVQHRRYDKIYFYPISKSPLIKIFNKDDLIDLIKKSDYQLNDDIELTYINKNNEKIIILFKKDNYYLVGWRVIDQLKNIINFSIKIKDINSEIDPKIFKIPSDIKG